MSPSTTPRGWFLPPEHLPHAASTHLHRVCLAGARLAIGEDADVEAVDAGRYQGLNLLEHLGRRRGMEGVGPPGLRGPGAPTSSKPTRLPRSLSFRNVIAQLAHGGGTGDYSGTCTRYQWQCGCREMEGKTGQRLLPPRPEDEAAQPCSSGPTRTPTQIALCLRRAQQNAGRGQHAPGTSSTCRGR